MYDFLLPGHIGHKYLIQHSINYVCTSTSRLVTERYVGIACFGSAHNIYATLSVAEVNKSVDLKVS